eukprot:6159151-Pyramimonas_sp.AAC.1
MFVVFSLRYRARVTLRHGDRSEDALRCAAWADGAATSAAKCRAISCALHDDGCLNAMGEAGQ